MAEYLVTEQAKEDLINIWIYIAVENHSKSSGDNLLNKFEEKFKLIAENPKLGRRQDEIKKGLRQFVVGNYLILYFIQDQSTIVVIRVMHGARNIQNLL